MRNRISNLALSIVMLAGLVVFADAQIADKKSLNLDGAHKVIDAAKEYAKKVNEPGVPGPQWVPAAQSARAKPTPAAALHYRGQGRDLQACDVYIPLEKGAVLFDRAGANYMIHPSRRTQPGKVEVHTKDTDFIYV